jgi:hypothetical protein
MMGYDSKSEVTTTSYVNREERIKHARKNHYAVGIFTFSKENTDKNDPLNWMLSHKKKSKK